MEEELIIIKEDIQFIDKAARYGTIEVQFVDEATAKKYSLQNLKTNK